MYEKAYARLTPAQQVLVARLEGGGDSVKEVRQACRDVTRGIYSTGRYDLQLRKLLDNCARLGSLPRGPPGGPVSIRVGHVMGLLVHEAFVSKNQTSSLPAVVSQLRTRVKKGHTGYKWRLGETGQAEVAVLIKFLQKVRPSVRVRARIIDKALLRRIYDYLQTGVRAGNAFAVQMWCICAVAHQTMRRLGSLLYDNVTIGDVDFIHTQGGALAGARIFLPLGKTHKAAASERCFTYMRARDDVFDAVSALQRHMEALGVTDENKLEKGRELLFRRLHASGEPAPGWGRGYRKDAFVRDLRLDVLGPAGVEDPEEYTGHGFRAGGLTDMVAEGVAWRTIARIGDWSDNSTSMAGYDRPREVTLVTRYLKRGNGAKHPAMPAPAGRGPQARVGARPIPSTLGSTLPVMLTGLEGAR